MKSYYKEQEIIADRFLRLPIVQRYEICEKMQDIYGCYSLDKPADIEKKLALMKEQSDIDYYLTGFSGGVRYAPVVRYNKVHVYISEEESNNGTMLCKGYTAGKWI